MAILRLGPSDTFGTVAGDNDNVAPVTPITDLNRLFLAAAAGVANINGISAGLDGQILWLVNTGPSDIILIPEAATAVAARRLYGDANFTIPQFGTMPLYYDTTLTRWVIGIF